MPVYLLNCICFYERKKKKTFEYDKTKDKSRLRFLVDQLALNIRHVMAKKMSPLVHVSTKCIHLGRRRAALST